MTTTGLRLLPVGDAHAELLWTWANDPEVRAAGADPEPIGWEEHVRWLSAQLRTALAFWLVVDGDAPVGQVRATWHDQGSAELHVSLAPDQRGRGLGPAAIRIACDKLATLSDVRRIVARVRTDNPRSRAAFTKAGFSSSDSEGSEDATFTSYELTLQPNS